MCRPVPAAAGRHRPGTGRTRCGLRQRETRPPRTVRECNPRSSSGSSLRGQPAIDSAARTTGSRRLCAPVVAWRPASARTWLPGAARLTDPGRNRTAEARNCAGVPSGGAASAGC